MAIRISGTTGLYGIVAHPIKHTISPFMHNCAFEKLGIDDVYMAFDVEEKDFDIYMKSVRVLPIKGMNVSMPYKQKIIPYLDELSDEAKLCQAVNTVKNVNGHLIGHITDGEGFYHACLEKDWHIDNQKIVMLGAGGAAKAIIVSLARHGAKEIVVYNRHSYDYIQELNEHFETSISLKDLSCKDELKKDIKDSYLLIQATSVGMVPHEKECLICEDMFVDGLKVADLIYNPKETILLKKAKSFGLETMNGEGMLLYQGALAFEFWTNQKMPINDVKERMRQ